MSTGAAPVIAVDGPGGSGKGTLAYRLSRALGFHLLDSGALYRLTALSARRRGVAIDDADGLARAASELDARFTVGRGDPPVRVLLAGQGVDAELRSERCAEEASRVAELPAVRAALLTRQREFRRPPGLVADGRDMGSVVFPDAELKIFLIASPEVRARRRHKQLIEKGISVNVATLREEIEARDRRDSVRGASPLRPAADAVVLDTTALGCDAVFERAMSLVIEHGLVDADAGND